MTYRDLIKYLQTSPSVDLDEDVTLILDGEAYQASVRQIEPDEDLASVLDDGHTVLEIREFSDEEKAGSILEGK